MKTISISVKNKIATVDGNAFIVNGNSDVLAKFTFDAEWEDSGPRTAVFVLSDGSAHSLLIQNGQCAVPPLYNTAFVKIGVRSAAVRTSTSAAVQCLRCVTDEALEGGITGGTEYEALCGLIDQRGVPKGGAAGQALVKKSSADGDCGWGAPDVSGYCYSKQQTDSLLSERAYKRKTLYSAGSEVELTDNDDYILTNVGEIVFYCGAPSICQSHIVLTTAASGAVSVTFNGTWAYAGDTATELGNGETWEFSLYNGRVIGRRW